VERVLNEYEAYIPGFNAGKQVKFKIMAVDNAGNMVESSIIEYRVQVTIPLAGAAIVVVVAIMIYRKIGK